MMEVIRFYDSALALAFSPREYVSLTYSRQFQNFGKLEITLVAPCEAKTGFYIECGGAFYIIVGTHCTQDTVTYFAEGILSLISRPVLPAQSAYYLAPDKIAGNLASVYASKALCAPLTVKSELSLPYVNCVLEAGNLLTHIRNLAASYAFGVSLDYDSAATKFTFAVKSSTDRTVGVSDSPIYLNKSFGTADSVSYSLGLENYRNRAIVRGAEKADGTYYTATVNASEFDFGDTFDDSDEEAREIYIKSGIGVGVYTLKNGTSSVFDSQGYMSALRDRGRRALALHRPCVKLEISVSPATGESLSPGDICTLNAPETSIGRVRADKITHISDEKGTTVLVSFTAV